MNLAARTGKALFTHLCRLPVSGVLRPSAQRRCAYSGRRGAGHVCTNLHSPHMVGFRVHGHNWDLLSDRVMSSL